MQGCGKFVGAIVIDSLDRRVRDVGMAERVLRIVWERCFFVRDVSASICLRQTLPVTTV